MIKTEFEGFYYHINKHLSHLSTEEVDVLKSKICRSGENYSNIALGRKKNDVIDNLIKHKNIVVIRQDKGRGVVLMDKSKYIEKCLQHLDTRHFVKQPTDNTQTIENKVQRMLLKIRKNIVKNDRLYPSGSDPGTAKVHKLEPCDRTNIEKQTIRPIISNNGTATYETDRYLSKLLAPLGKSKHTVASTKEFIEKIKKIKAPGGNQMISFDVKSIFTSFPLDETINIILDKTYVDRIIQVPFDRSELKSLLQLCTKEVAFSFNEELYTQAEGIAMGSPLGPLFANVFMCELENDILPQLENHMVLWHLYVDDTFTFINPNIMNNVLDKLNTYHPNVQFTYEIEKLNKISFWTFLCVRWKMGD